MEFISTKLSSTELFMIAYTHRAVLELGTSMGSKEVFDTMTPNKFGSSLYFWLTAALKDANSNSVPEESLLTTKKRADEQAPKKECIQAIASYTLIYFTATTLDHVLKVQSLTNSAALRLRLSSFEPLHLPLAIFECTMAIEIDPNHVKALFRRGLALALCKRWSQAIIHFERALELDPNSPARKELEVARRQVTRRIGN